MNNNKNGFNVVDSVDSKKEFDRSICFTFFESYLEQGELVNMNLGSEACANYFIALCKYALYQEEPEDLMIKMLISGLKNTIDAGQNKRAKSFKGEDVDMTNKILKYKEDNPEASYRQIADALGCSKSKVGKVLSSNSNLNNNLNTNSNLNSNYNTVDADADTSHSQENRERELTDLTKEELESIKSDYKSKVKYRDTQNRLGLSCDITKDTWKEVDGILTQRKKEGNDNKNKNALSKFGLTISEGDMLAKNLTDCSWSAWGEYAESNLESYLTTIGMTPQELLSFFSNNELATRSIYDEYVPKSSWDNKKKFYRYYDEYLEDYIKNKEDVIRFVEDKIAEKNLYAII